MLRRTVGAFSRRAFHHPRWGSHAWTFRSQLLPVSRPRLFTRAQHSNSGRIPISDLEQPKDGKHFAELAGNGKAGIAEAEKLLSQTKARLLELPLEQRRQEAAKLEAWRILQWMLAKFPNDHKMWDMYLSRDFANPLCWFLEAEGNNEFVLEWVKAYSSRFSSADCPAWTLCALASMVLARLEWSSDGTADSALELLMHAHRECPTAPTLGARRVVERYLLNDTTPPGSPVVFERYMALNCCARTPPERLKLQRLYEAQTQAMLWLCHPTTPLTSPILRLLRIARSSTELELIQKRKDSMAHSALRAYYILQLLDEHDDAEFALESAKALSSRAWAARRKVYNACREDKKLERLHRQHPLTPAIRNRIW